MNLVSSSKRIRDTLFFLIVFCIIFDYGPKAIWNNLWGLGGPYSNMLGGGAMLNGAYVVEHFDDFDLQSREVQQWIDAYWEMGPLKHNFDAMNEYATVFATKGILGLLCLLFPFIFGCTVLLRCIRKCSDTVMQVRLFSLILATISSLVAGGNGSLILIYAVWILLSLVYIALLDKELGNEKSF